MARRRSARSRRRGRGVGLIGRLAGAAVIAVLTGLALTHLTGLDQESVRMLAMLAAGIYLGRGWRSARLRSPVALGSARSRRGLW
jgi:hypothetical protein